MAAANPTSAFDAIASAYDTQFTDSTIGRAQRRAVLRVADRVFQPGQRILELNCGTGVDALHLSRRGVEVVATDASSEMVSIARERCRDTNARFLVCPIEQLSRLRGFFDGVFSNFSGINCIADLDRMSVELARLVKPGGSALLCVFGSFCAWECAWYLCRGDVQRALRRTLGSSRAQLGSASIDVRYWRTRDLRRALDPWFELTGQHGVGMLLPPSYLESLAQRWPRALHFAEAADARLARNRMFRMLADHKVLEFRRTSVKVRTP